MRNVRVDAMVLAYTLMLPELPEVPAWRKPVKTRRSRLQAKKRKAKRKCSSKSRKRNR